MSKRRHNAHILLMALIGWAVFLDLCRAASPTPVVPARSADQTFVAFDIETTGFSPARDRILEIGAVKLRGGRILARRSWLINPEMAVPQAVQRVNGITADMVTDCPRFDAVFPHVRTFLDDAVLLAHNAGFDCRFLAAELDRCGIPYPTNLVLDTLRIYRQSHPRLPSYSLASLVAAFLPSSPSLTAATDTANSDRTARPHSAQWDAECVAALFMRNPVDPVGALSLPDLVAGEGERPIPPMPVGGTWPSPDARTQSGSPTSPSAVRDPP